MADTSYVPLTRSGFPFVVEVSCASDEEADRIGSSAVAQGLAAAAHFYPVSSTYRWEGELHRTTEYVLWMVTSEASLDLLTRHIKSEHSYKLPHVLVSPQPSTTPSIDLWLEDSTIAPDSGAVRSRLCYITMKVLDLERQARFWASVLGGARAQVSAGSGERYAVVRAQGSEIRLLLEVVQALPSGASRVHLDIEADDVVAEKERLLGLGASLVHEKHENGFVWFVLRDPEGNEVCILQPRYPHLLSAAPPCTT